MPIGVLIGTDIDVITLEYLLKAKRIKYNVCLIMSTYGEIIRGCRTRMPDHVHNLRNQSRLCVA